MWAGKPRTRDLISGCNFRFKIFHALRVCTDDYFQETGRDGRDGTDNEAVLCLPWVHVSRAMKAYCSSQYVADESYLRGWY